MKAKVSAFPPFLVTSKWRELGVLPVSREHTSIIPAPAAMILHCAPCPPFLPGRKPGSTSWQSQSWNPKPDSLKSKALLWALTSFVQMAYEFLRIMRILPASFSPETRFNTFFHTEVCVVLQALVGKGDCWNWQVVQTQSSDHNHIRCKNNTP